MYLCYVDESGDPGPQGSSHLVLTGAALFEGKWRYLREELERLIHRYWPVGARPTEIHLAELRSGKGPFRSLAKPARLQLEVDLCALVANLLSTELRVFTVIADKRAWFGRNPGKLGDDLYVEMFEQLSSRFDMFLRRRSAEGAPSKGIVIADPHKDQLSRVMRSQYAAAQAHGNRWSSIYNLIETIFFLDSHESPGLQMADLMSYAVWRLVTAGDDALAQQVSGCFDREPLNSSKSPGKWHGIKTMDLDPAVMARIHALWP